MLDIKKGKKKQTTEMEGKRDYQLASFMGKHLGGLPGPSFNRCIRWDEAAGEKYRSRTKFRSRELFQS